MKRRVISHVVEERPAAGCIVLRCVICGDSFTEMSHGIRCMDSCMAEWLLEHAHDGKRTTMAR